MSHSASRGGSVVACLLASILLASLSAAQDDEEKKLAATRDFNSTAALQNGGLYERAATRWEEFLKNYPADERLGEAQYYLGVCRLHTKEFDKSADAFRTVISKYPQLESVDAARYHLGMALYEKARQSNKPDDYKAAAGQFAETARQHPGSRYAAGSLYLQGESLYSAGEPEGALAPYQELIAKHPKSPLAAEAYYYLGVTQQELGKSEDAAATYRAFLQDAGRQKHAHAGEVRLRLGVVLFDAGKLDEAEKQFAEVAAEADGPHADFAVLRQAQCRLEGGKAAEAAALLEQFPGKFPESGYLNDARLALGKARYQSESYDAAREPLSQAAQAAEGDKASEASYWLARTELARDKPQEALAAAEAALGKNPQGEFAPYLKMARIDALYDIPQRRKEAGPLCETFLSEHSQHALAPQARYMAALAAFADEDYPAARRQAEAFLAAENGGEHELAPAVIFLAAESHLLAGAEDQGADLAKAQALYEQLIARHAEHPRAARARVRVGWCLYRRGQYDAAVQSLAASLAALKEPADVAEAQLVIGRSQAAAGRDEPALAAFDAGLKAAPQWDRRDEMLLAAAQSERRLDRLDAAKARLEQVISLSPQSSYRPQATFLLGETLKEQGKPEEAIQRYSQVVSQHGESEFAAPAAYGAASARFEQDDVPQALAALDQLLAKYPENKLAGPAHYLRGLCLQRQEKHQPAAAEFEAFLKTNPQGQEAIDARYALALCQEGLGRHAEAAESLAVLIAGNPNYEHLDKLYYDRGHVLLAADKPDEAAVSFAALIEKRPQSPLVAESWFHVGRAREAAADKETDETQQRALLAKAEEAYAAGSQQAGDAELKEKLAYKLGVVLFAQEKYDAAATRLLAQIKEFPEGELYGPAAFLAGESLYRQDKYAEAEPLFAEVASKKFQPYEGRALYLAGASAGNLKQWGRSRQHYAALIQQHADFEQIDEARYGLAWALQNEGNTAEARRTYQQIAAKPNSEAAAKANFMLGELSFAEEKYEEAIEQFLKVAVGYPYEHWQGMAHFEAGRCWLELGKKDQAIRSLSTVAEKYPEHEKAAAAKALLAELK